MPEIELLATGEVSIGCTIQTPGGSAPRPRRLPAVHPTRGKSSRFLRRFHDPTRWLTGSGRLAGAGPIVIGRAAKT
jgi:hypothetical protein